MRKHDADSSNEYASPSQYSLFDCHVFPRRVLQAEYYNEWHPSPHGAENIAVLPGQSFAAWIGPDESFTKDQLEKLRGNNWDVRFSGEWGRNKRRAVGVCGLNVPALP